MKRTLKDTARIKTGLRRRGREIALSILFQYEASESPSPEETFNLFCANFGPSEDADEVLGLDLALFEQALPFVRDLFFGVASHQAELDRKIMEASDNWRIDRMSRVDRNVMRLALFEMLYRKDIPPKVSINEAIELGKEFGAQDSGAFINGILDRIRKQAPAEDVS
ncbi:MAG: transcription antitermination factor NusB [Pseudomonadota bacterium]